MFESLRSWFNSLDQQCQLFDNADDESIHIALASLLYHIISADKLPSEREKHKFSLILQEEFGLSNHQVLSLYQYVQTLQTDFHDDLKTIDEHLQQKPYLRMTFMQKLIQLISVDGVTNSEMDIFNDAMNVVFPELGDRDSEL